MKKISTAILTTTLFAFSIQADPIDTVVANCYPAASKINKVQSCVIAENHDNMKQVFADLLKQHNYAADLNTAIEDNADDISDIDKINDAVDKEFDDVWDYLSKVNSSLVDAHADLFRQRVRLNHLEATVFPPAPTDFAAIDGVKIGEMKSDNDGNYVNFWLGNYGGLMSEAARIAYSPYNANDYWANLILAAEYSFDDPTCATMTDVTPDTGNYIVYRKEWREDTPSTPNDRPHNTYSDAVVGQVQSTLVSYTTAYTWDDGTCVAVRDTMQDLYAITFIADIDMDALGIEPYDGLGFYFQKISE